MKEEESMAGAVAVLFILMFILVIFAICIVMIIAEWKLFKKAGQPGWAAIVPFYNAYVLTKITWGGMAGFSCLVFSRWGILFS